MGSMVYAEAARERRDDIRLMMSLEMLGSYSDQPGSQRYPPLFQYFYKVALGGTLLRERLLSCLWAFSSGNSRSTAGPGPR
jgi:hypothetical protein